MITQSARARLPRLQPTSPGEGVASGASAKRDPRIARLPKVARELAERLGYDAGVLLIEKFGGMQLSIPGPSGAKCSRISRELGEEVARVVCELWGASRVDVPTGARIKSADLRQAINEHPGSHNEAARALPPRCRNEQTTL